MCAVSPVSLACGLTVCVCVCKNIWPTSVCKQFVDPETAHELKAKEICRFFLKFFFEGGAFVFLFLFCMFF